jgi:hypothetical protein
MSLAAVVTLRCTSCKCDHEPNSQEKWTGRSFLRSKPISDLRLETWKLRIAIAQLGSFHLSPLSPKSYMGDAQRMNIPITIRLLDVNNNRHAKLNVLYSL